MTSPFAIKMNDAFLFLAESDQGTVQHAVFQIKNRSYYLSVSNDTGSPGPIVNCATERELVVTLHHILRFAEVDMIYSFNGITDNYMKNLYSRNGLNTYFWGSRVGRMFVCRPITMHGSLVEFAKVCPEYEMPLNPKEISELNMEIKDQMAIGDIMTMLELLSFYVKFHPLTYNKIERY